MKMQEHWAGRSLLLGQNTGLAALCCWERKIHSCSVRRCAMSCKTKHTATIWSSNCTLGSLSQKNKNFTHHNKKLETTGCCSVGSVITCSNPYCGTLVSDRQEGTIKTHTTATWRISRGLRCSQEHYLQRPRHGATQAPFLTGWEDVVYTQWSVSHEKEWKIVICSNVDEPLRAQLVKNPPARWETWVWSLGWEDSLEKEKATHSSILA